MQEEVENRTVNLAISTTKLTGRTIIAGIRKYLQHREKVKMKKARDPAVHGKQSVKQLLGQNQGATNVEIDKESIRDFEKLAKKYGVDFAVDEDMFLAEAREQFGAKGAKEAQEVLGRVSSLFAGGDLDEDAKDVFFQALMAVYMDSKKNAKEKFTPKKYRKHKKLAQSEI